MDRTITIHRDWIFTLLQGKLIYLYLYIPPHSVDYSGMLTRLISGNILQIHSLWSQQEDINRLIKIFHERLPVHLYQRDLNYRKIIDAWWQKIIRRSSVFDRCHWTVQRQYCCTSWRLKLDTPRGVPKKTRNRRNALRAHHPPPGSINFKCSSFFSTCSLWKLWRADPAPSQLESPRSCVNQDHHRGYFRERSRYRATNPTWKLCRRSIIHQAKGKPWRHHFFRMGGIHATIPVQRARG